MTVKWNSISITYLTVHQSFKTEKNIFIQLKTIQWYTISVYYSDSWKQRVLKDLIIHMPLTCSCCKKQNMHKLLQPNTPHSMLDLHKIASNLERGFTFCYNEKVTLFQIPYQFQKDKWVWPAKSHTEEKWENYQVTVLPNAGFCWPKQPLLFLFL